MKNNYHIEPRGSTLERAIINVLNFLTDIVTETIIKPNVDKLDKNVEDTSTLKVESIDTYEDLLDTKYKLEVAEDDITNNLESILDLQYEVEQLKESVGV